MSLLLGIAAGLAYGLCAVAGGFAALALLVLFAGLSVFQALPVALFALGICTAIAAGDAVRARQCDAQLSGWLVAGAVPAALAFVVVALALPAPALATIYGLAALASCAFVLYRCRAATLLAPAALLHAPRRTLAQASDRPPYSRRARGLIAVAGAGNGALLGLCAAPTGWAGRRALRRLLGERPHQVAGTLALALALVAIVASALAFALAPALPGYAAGLYVLGAVAGMGLARRAWVRLPVPATHAVIAAAVAIAALAVWITVLGGLPPGS